MKDYLRLTGTWPLTARTGRFEAEHPPRRSSQVNLLQDIPYSFYTPISLPAAGVTFLKHNDSTTTQTQPATCDGMPSKSMVCDKHFFIWSFTSQFSIIIGDKSYYCYFKIRNMRFREVMQFVQSLTAHKQQTSILDELV